MTMWLPLLGACAVVGPFQGPQWEPVRGLLSQDVSCKDPRCCGNLLVVCLFLIWLVRRYWYRVIRTRSRKRNAIKMLSQKWGVPSIRRETSYRMVPELFFTPGKIRDLDVHVREWTSKQRWGCQRNLQQPWTQCLRPPQNSCQDLPWGVHIPSEPIFRTSSFSSPCLIPQDSSWETWQVPWGLKNSQGHPSLDTYQRTEKLLVSSQEMVVPAEPVVSMKYCPASTTVSLSLPNLSSAQRLKFCVRECPTHPPNQKVRMPTWKSCGGPQEAWAPCYEAQSIDRNYSKESQALKCTSQREHRREDAWKSQASGDQVPTNFRMKDSAKAKALGCRKQMLVISEMDGEMLTPVEENKDRLGVENRAQTEKLWGKKQGETGDESPSSQAHMGESQDQLRCKTDVATQTPEWEDLDKGASETAVETYELVKNEKEASGEQEGEVQVQVQVPGTQGWIGAEDNEDSKVLQLRTKGRIGSEGGVQILTSGRKKLRVVRQQGDAETQALEWEKQRHIRNENGIQTPAGGKQGQSGSVKARKTQASKRESQNLSGHAAQEGRGHQGLGRGEDARELQIPRMKKLREIREEDWVVIQAPWWGSQRLVVNEMNREFKIPHWRNESHVGGEYVVESQVPEESDQRIDGEKRVTNILPPEAENQGHLRGKTDADTHSAERKNEEQIEEDGTDIQVLGERNTRVFVKGEDDTETQKLGKENQGLLGNEFHAKIHTSKWKNQKNIRGNNSENTQASEAETGEEFSDVDGGICAVEQDGDENGAEIQIQDTRNLTGIGGEEGAGTWARVESQRQLSDMGMKTHLSEWKNQKRMGGERTEVQAPEKRNQEELGDKDDAKTWTPVRENQGQLESEIPRSWEPTKGEKAAETQAPDKRNWRVAGSEDGRKIQRLGKTKQRLLRGRVNRNTHYSPEWKNQPHCGGEHGAEIQIQRKRNPRRPPGGDDPKTQVSIRDGQSRCETDGEIETQGRGMQDKGGDERPAEIQDVGNQRKCRAKGAGQPRAPRRGDKGQVGGKGAALSSFQGDCSGGEGLTGRKYSLAQPPALTVSGHGVLEHEQTVAVTAIDSVPCPERRPHRHGGEVILLAGGEEHLTAPSWKHRAEVGLASQQPTGPALKKSKRLLLESLMKRRIAHLRWGLPRRILESYLLFHFLEPRSPPLAGVRLSGLRTDQALQRQQGRHGKGQSSLLGFQPSERSQGVPAPERKSSQLQARALENRPPRSEPKGSAIPPTKPRRTRPPGGARELQIREGALPAKMPAAGNPRPASESRSWCGPGRVQEPSREHSGSGRMMKPGVSPTAERALGAGRASISTAGHSYWKKECCPWETPKLYKLKCQQPTYWRSGSLEPEEDRRAWQKPSPGPPHTPGFRGSVQSAAARLSETLLRKMPWCPQPARPQRSAPNLALAPAREDSIRVRTALRRDLQSPGHPGDGVPLPRTKSHQELGTPGIQNEVPGNPPAPQKFGFVKHLRCFLRQRGFKKSPRGAYFKSLE